MQMLCLIEYKLLSNDHCLNSRRRYMAETLPIRRKTLYNQSIVWCKRLGMNALALFCLDTTLKSFSEIKLKFKPNKTQSKCKVRSQRGKAILYRDHE